MTPPPKKRKADDIQSPPVAAAAAVAAAATPLEDLSKDAMMELIRSQMDTMNTQRDTIDRLQSTIQSKSIDQMVKHGIPELAENSSEKPHEDISRSATIENDASFVTTRDLSFNVNVRDNAGGLLQSSLLQKLDFSPNVFQLTYENEATVQHYVQLLMEDALKSMTCNRTFQLFCEMSIFSLRPDLIVVMHPQLGVILVVEVKNPGDVIVTSEPIAGQIFDYLKGMERLGHSTPFVVIASYKKIIFARLSGTKKKIEYDAVVKKSAGELFDLQGRHEVSVTTAGTKPTKSPQGKGIKDSIEGKRWIHPTPIPPTTGEYEDSEEEDKSAKLQGGTVVYSQVFDESNVFKAMILAIKCGIQSLNTVNAELRDSLPVHNEKLSVDLAFVTKTFFTWKKCKQPILYDASSSNGCKRFYLLNELGRGQHGKVFLACDVYGRTCALKFFLENSKDWKSYHYNDRQDGKQKSLEEVKKMVKEELNRWEKLYPEFKLCTHVLELNHQIVLKMPYLTSVPLEKRLDMCVLQQVKRQLERFESLNLHYNEVRWQHVGCSRNKNDELAITMLDLGSLSIESKLSVEAHMKALVQRSGKTLSTSEVESLLKEISHESSSTRSTVSMTI